MAARRAPKYARKLLELPPGIRLDRARALLSAIEETELLAKAITLVPLADGSIGVYKHNCSQA